MTESTTVQDGLNRALRTLIDDLMADRPSALATFEAWCLEHREDIELMALIQELEPPNHGNE